MADVSAKRVGANAGMLVVSRVASVVLLLALTPLIVAKLGPAGYGVWVILTAATGLFGLVDVGISPAVARLVSVAAPRNDFSTMRSAIATAACASLLFGTALASVAWYLAPELARLVEAPPRIARHTAEALRLAVVAFVFSNLAAVFEGALIGQQRFHALVVVRFAYIALFAAGSVVMLQAGAGIVGLAGSQAVAMGVATVMSLVVVNHSVRLVDRISVTGAALRQLLRFGLPQQLSRIAYAGALHYERLLIGFILGAAVAGEYGAASVVVGSACSLLSQSTVALIPALSEIQVQRPAGLMNAFLKAAAVFTALAVGLIGVLGGTAAPALGGWLGTEFMQADRHLQVLSVGFLMWAIAHPGFALAQSLGHPRLEGRAAAVVILVNLLTTTALLTIFEERGIALGVSLALTLGAAVFWRSFLRRQALPLRLLVRRVTPAVVTGGVLAFAFAFANDVLVKPNGFSRMEMIFVAALEAGLFAAVYLGVLRRLDYFADTGVATLPLLCRRQPGRGAHAEGPGADKS